MHSVTELLSPDRARCHVSCSSKKRIFEIIAEAVGEDHPDLDAADVITQLLDRERLGSTGLGRGIAIPHCRLEHCSEPMGVIMTLEEPTDFDAPDDQPVDLLFALLVPKEATQEHLDMLAAIARLFSQEEFCEKLRACDTEGCLYETAVGWEG
jgi:PTS system nitrogen regulatory IIA component